jgi:SAM-dependent methyltransferase
MEELRFFRDFYVPAGASVLDVGSWGTGRITARDLFPARSYLYVGLDIQEGNNVDFVPADPYRWEEVADESFDAVVSANCFEHNAFFWITMAEIARVLRPGGHVCMISPSAGGVHRFPLDCWRFYPDATAALAAYTGLEAIESYNEAPRFRKVTFGQRWRDHLTIARKPDQVDEEFYERLGRITATRLPMPDRAPDSGQVIAAYESAQRSTLLHASRVRAALVWYRLRHRGQPSGLW